MNESTKQAGRPARGIGFAAAVMIAAVLVSRLLGFARDAFIAYAFGATGATDAFYAAFTLPDALNYLLAGGTLSITFIPLYARHLAAGDEDEGNRVFSIIATVMGVVMAAGVALLEWQAPALVHRYLGALRPDDLARAVTLTRILLPAQLFFYVGGLASASLMARRHFVAAALAPILYNAGTIAGAATLRGSLGVDALAWGTLAGAAAGPFLLQLVAAWRAGLRYRPRFDVRHGDFRRWLVLTLPLMIGVSLVTADEWILKYFAAADVGAISQLSYARKLVMVPIAIAGQAVGQASMPFFARLFAESKRKELASLVARSARASGAIAAVVAAALAALAEPVTDLLFRRGRFDASEVAPTALYVAVFAVAIPLWGVQGIVARAFYATGDTATPMVAGTIVTALCLPIYAFARHLFGVAGLAVASDVGIALHTVALLLLVRRRIPELDRSIVVVGVGKAAIVAIVAGAPAWLVSRAIGGALVGVAPWLADLACIGGGGAVFVLVVVALARPLGVEDVLAALDRVTGRLRRRALATAPPKS